MKLVLVIVNNEDSAVVASALTAEGYFVTKLSTTGGFLMIGNTTLLIGTDDDKVENIKEILKKHSSTRTAVNPTHAAYGRGLSHDGLPDEVKVGGATYFVRFFGFGFSVAAVLAVAARFATVSISICPPIVPFLFILLSSATTLSSKVLRSGATGTGAGRDLSST